MSRFLHSSTSLGAPSHNATLHVNFDCDPCISRSQQFRITVIMDGTTYKHETKQQNDQLKPWQLQVKATMLQQQVYATAETAGASTSLPELDFIIYNADKFSPALMAQDIIEYGQRTVNDLLHNALVVSIPDDNRQNGTNAVIRAVNEVITNYRIPVFIFNSGFLAKQERDGSNLTPLHHQVVGYIGQDERLAGTLAATEFLKTIDTSILAQSKVPVQRKVAFVYPIEVDDTDDLDRMEVIDTILDVDVPSTMKIRFEAFQEALLNPATLLNTTADAIEGGYNSTIYENLNVNIEMVYADPITYVFDHVTKINNLFEQCEVDFVMLGCHESVEVAVDAQKQHNCTRTKIGVFGDTPTVIDSLKSTNYLRPASPQDNSVFFAISPQLYLQSMLTLQLASTYITTGKALSLPIRNQMYNTGPKLITTENVYADKVQECVIDTFPICADQEEIVFDGIDSGSSAEIYSSVENNGANGVIGWKDVLSPPPSLVYSQCPCADRPKIRIGGSIHGVTTDTFWDPVFASLAQAADDMKIELDLIRFPPNDLKLVSRQMAARIRSLCEDGVDGIVVTIPNDEVVESIKRCQELGVPVVSMNSGGDKSLELGLLNYVGMVDYNAGYKAGLNMIQSGMKVGYCPIHEIDVTTLHERCQGFRDAILDTNDPNVTYGGKFAVPRDNSAKYLQTIEEFVGYDGDWDEVGIMVSGAHMIMSWLKVKEAHKNAIGGTFDVTTKALEAISDGLLNFAIDQQPYLQGSLPIYLLTSMLRSKQSLETFYLETGPNFVAEAKSSAEVVCESNFFEMCEVQQEEDLNLVNLSLRMTGHALSAILLGLALFCAGFTYAYREKAVVKVSQPLFLYIMITGVIISSLSIPFMKFETGHRNIQDELTGELLEGTVSSEIRAADASCMAVPWLYGMGFAIVFSALFAKINRVKLVISAGLALRRQVVKIQDVLSIVAGLMVAELTLLVTWQLSSPLKWVREITKENGGIPLSSFGQCRSEKGANFWVAMVLLHLVCLLYALVLSWQTRNIDSGISESSTLFLCVMCIFQVQVLTVPILALIQNDPNVFYFVQMAAVFLQNVSVICFMFGTKVYTVMIQKSDVDFTRMSHSIAGIGESRRRAAIMLRIDSSSVSQLTGSFSSMDQFNNLSGSLRRSFPRASGARIDSDDSSNTPEHNNFSSNSAFDATEPASCGSLNAYGSSALFCIKEEETIGVTDKDDYQSMKKGLHDLDLQDLAEMEEVDTTNSTVSQP